MNRVFESLTPESPTRWLRLALLAVLTSSCVTEGLLGPTPEFVASVAAAGAAGGAAGIHGKGSTGPGGYDLALAANSLPNGSAAGHSRLVGGATGPVVQVVPPSGARDFWCVTIRRTDTGDGSGDQRINWYVRDIGDGGTTFDQISFVTSIGGDCTTFPSPLGVFLTLTAGD